MTARKIDRSKLPHQIDHVLVHKDYFYRFTDCGVSTPLVHSDHQAVMCKVRLIARFKVKVSIRQKMIKLDSNPLSNIEAAREFAQNVINNYDHTESANYSNLSKAIEKTAFETLPKKSRPQPDWFSADQCNLLDLINRRNCALKVHINRSTRFSTQNLRRARKELSVAIARAKEKWILQRLDALNSTATSTKGTKICWDTQKRFEETQPCERKNDD